MRSILPLVNVKHAHRLAPPFCSFSRVRTIRTSARSSAEVQLPKLIVSPGSIHHNSLATFLEYANRVGLTPSKTVYKGTHYEYTAALSLLRLGFSLTRTGRRSDGGIDLIGHWMLPQLDAPLPVILQCKARQASCGPRHIRELEGAFQGIPPDWRKRDVLGLLVTTQKHTKGLLAQLQGSRWPMGFVKITEEGVIEQFLWNQAATTRGLEGIGVTLRHTPRIFLPESAIKEQGEEGLGWNVKRRKKKVDVSGTDTDIQLTWMGRPIFPERHGLGEDTMRLMGQLGVEEDGEDERTVATRALRRKKSSIVETAVGSTTTRRTAAVKKSARERTASRTVSETPVKRKRGRPTGSKNKIVLAVKSATKPGRPKGSKKEL
jgi:hypothetical protein